MAVSFAKRIVVAEFFATGARLGRMVSGRVVVLATLSFFSTLFSRKRLQVTGSR